MTDYEEYENEMDWYGMIDATSNDEFSDELMARSKDELVTFAINLIRGWAYQQKQIEIRDEHFYRELQKLAEVPAEQ